MQERKSHYRKWGDEAEATARRLLERKGYAFLAARFQTHWGEIDLVMEKGKRLVFVEVKFRHNTKYGRPEEAITWGKKQKMVKTAMDYVRQNGISGRMLQFDVVTIGPNGVRHFPNAFSAGRMFYY